MTAHVRVLNLKQINQIREVYERALSVRTMLPENHPASIAAKKLIDAFEMSPDQPEGTIFWSKTV